MQFNGIDSLTRTGDILSLIGARQKVLGANIANMDTPGYQKKDISFADVLSSGSNSLETQLAKKFDGSFVQTNMSDEPVNPSEELVKMQQNSLLYTVASRRMSNVITQMKTVINVGK